MAAFSRFWCKSDCKASGVERGDREARSIHGNAASFVRPPKDYVSSNSQRAPLSDSSRGADDSANLLDDSGKHHSMKVVSTFARVPPFSQGESITNDVRGCDINELQQGSCSDRARATTIDSASKFNQQPRAVDSTSIFVGFCRKKYRPQSRRFALFLRTPCPYA